MTTYAIQTAFPTFHDIDGEPLNAGFIYIGEPNQDPVSNPISVYFDEALTVPAAQPIRTSNGVPVNSGSPAQLFVGADDYSITVQNKNNTLIYSLLSGGVGLPVGGGEYLLFHTFADLEASSLSVGQWAETKGYNTAGDGGGASYLIAATGAPTDLGNPTLTTNGNVAVLQHAGGEVDASKFGAVGTGDVTLALIDASIAARTLAFTLYIPSGDYLINQTLDFNQLTVRGELTYIKWNGSAGGLMAQARSNFFSLVNLTFDGLGVAANGFACGSDTSLGRYASFGSNLFRVNFSNFTDTAFDNIGTGAGAGEDAVDLKIDRCRFTDCGIGLKLRQPSHTINETFFGDCGYSMHLNDNLKVSITSCIFSADAAQDNTDAHLFLSPVQTGEIHATDTWFENGKPIEFGNTAPNIAIATNIGFTNCHISWPESKSGSVYNVDLAPLGRGNVAFIGCHFPSTTNQSIRLGNTGALITSCGFIDTGTETIPVRVTENIAGSTMLINSDGNSGVRRITASYLQAPEATRLELKDESATTRFSLRTDGAYNMHYAATGSFPDTTAFLLDPAQAVVRAFLVGQEGGDNVSLGVYDLIYRGGVWNLGQVSLSAYGNGHGTVAPSINGNYLSLANDNASSLGSYRIQVQYMMLGVT